MQSNIGELGKGKENGASADKAVAITLVKIAKYPCGPRGWKSHCCSILHSLSLPLSNAFFLSLSPYYNHFLSAISIHTNFFIYLLIQDLF